MKRLNNIVLRIILILSFFIFLISCEDNERMTGITTDDAVATGPTTARVSGTIGDLSSANHDEYGFCYSLGESPGIDSMKVILGDDPEKGVFSDTLTGLRGSTTYYVRAYIMEDDGYIYGKVKSFTTLPPQAPSVVTTAITAITTTSAVSGGMITYDGGADITSRGVCWDTIINPSLTDSHTVDGSGTGSYNSSINNLSPNVKYYVRAYAINSADTVYGNEHNFTTGTTWPTVITSPVTDVTYNSAVSGGDVTTNGGLPVTKRGVCWRTSPNPTVANDTTNNGTGTGAFQSQLKNLLPATTYYLRAYAVNTNWTAYGDETSFTTAATYPAVRIDSIRNIKTTTATVYSNAYYDGGSAITVRGVCWSATQHDPTTADDHTEDASGTGAFTSALTGLTGNTTYYIRAYATNAIGTTYSAEQSLTTASPLDVVTGEVSSITSNSAVCGGNVTGDGGYPVTARGVCWSLTSNPTLANSHTTDGTGMGSYVSNMTELTPFMTYYVRAYATNSQGTVYGNNETFATLPVAGDSITDIDGNVYHTVTIGTQIWLVENLKTTKYRNGVGIPGISNSTDWSNLTTGAYCNYDNVSNNADVYGRLYNWYAVNDSCNIAPTGWRVATDEDWTTLINYLGGESVAGGKLKETGYAHWASPNTGATNESGFTALPGGYRNFDGIFLNINGYANWWASSEYGVPYAWHFDISYENTIINRNYQYKKDGFSIRCIKGEAQLPTLSTTSVSSITTTTAVSGGNITNQGSSAVTARGVCWSTTQNPTTANSKTVNGSGTGSFVSNLTSLTPNTTYYVRAYATNGSGTAYGNELSFKAYSVMDIDGNGYYSVIIGTQEWLLENLKTTRYRNGENVENVTGNTTWGNLSTGAYCNFENNSANVSTYGRMYNWFAVNDSRNIAPTGWRVPSDNDWTILVNFLGGENSAGGKLKETGFDHWISPNTGATNETGFTALPGGLRDQQGSFSNLTEYGTWWSTTGIDISSAWGRVMYYNTAAIARGNMTKKSGFSVRCVKD